MSITATFMNTPLWVFPFFAVLIVIGVRGTRPRTIRRRQLYILPSVFLFISARQIFHTYPWDAQGLLAWSVPAVLTCIVGWAFADSLDIRVVRQAGTIDLPGTWVDLALIISAFVARLYFGRRLGIEPSLRMEPTFFAWVLGSTGLITGYYVGRSCCLLVRYFQSPDRRTAEKLQ